MSLIKIKDAGDNIGKVVPIRGILVDIEVKMSRKKDKYLAFSIKDKDDSMELTLWNVEQIDNVSRSLNKGDLIEVWGKASKYNEKATMAPITSITPKTDEPKSEYISSYTKEEIDEAAEAISENIRLLHADHVRVIDLIMDEKTGFYKCPASVRYHHNKIGGLAIHTAGVVTIVRGLLDNLQYHPNFMKVNRDIVIMAAILHDVCKTEEYEFENGIYRLEHSKLDHRVNFMQYKKQILEILGVDETEQLCRLVMSHHGPWGEYTPKSIEESVLHYADMLDVMMETAGTESFESLGMSLKQIIGFQK